MRSIFSRGRRAFPSWIRRAVARGAVLLCALTGSGAALGDVSQARAQASPIGASGAASNVVLSLSPSSIVADGNSTSAATVTVTDSTNQPVTGDTVQLSSPDSGEQLSSLTDNGNGTYSGTVKSSTTVGQVTITATDVSVSPHPFGQATLTQTAVSVAVSLLPSSIVADGSSMSTATATVEDPHGNPVTGHTIQFTSTGGQAIGTVTPHPDGTYTATITSTTSVGSSTVTATDTSVSPAASGQATLTQTVGPATGVAVSLSPQSIIADGASTSTATATVTDAEGHPISGATVGFSSTDSGQAIGPVVPQVAGTYTTTITSSTTLGAATITATDGAVSGNATLTQTAVPTATFISAPGSATTNQQVVLTATVDAGRLGPAGAIVFKKNGASIPGCTVFVAPSIPLVRCQTSFAAAEGSPTLSATFLPYSGRALPPRPAPQRRSGSQKARPRRR